MHGHIVEYSRILQNYRILENFSQAVGVDLSNQFEIRDSRTITELVDSLEHLLIDDETKVDYATHVFAKALDEMVDSLETPKLLN